MSSLLFVENRTLNRCRIIVSTIFEGYGIYAMYCEAMSYTNVFYLDVKKNYRSGCFLFLTGICTTSQKDVVYIYGAIMLNPIQGRTSTPE